MSFEWELAVAVSHLRERKEDMITDFETAEEITLLDLFMPVSSYRNSEEIRPGEIGKIFGVRIIIGEEGDQLNFSSRIKRKKIDEETMLGDS